ncbi:MAG: diguanylate cyclase [Chloroflexi bacterium]|nr:diguanylate cyclase [Chloroflexota bacterium]
MDFVTKAQRPRQGVLVIEDDPTLGALVRAVLRPDAGYVRLERSGAGAIQALREETFESIACDISLPDMSGLDVIAQARALAPATGIVAITGFVDVDVAVQSMKAGADDFLGKPFDPGILWHVLNKSVDNRRQRVEAERAEAYRKLAYTDTLTGCPNRRYIDEFLESAIARARQEDSPLVAAYLDIDNFKLLNDYVGHEEGDRVLARVASALEATLRPPIAFARFGGDEFVAIFPGAELHEAERVVERLRQVVSHIEAVNGARTALPIRVSCGLAAYRGVETPRSLIAYAEDQMYLDKSAAPILPGDAEKSDGAPTLLAKVTNLKALRSLVKAIDRRDSYTRYHSDHATHLALRLAREIDLPEDEVAAITLGGPIHDLGKIVVPDEILRKPGTLTPEERRNMEEHPVMGAAITAAVIDYDTVVNLVRHHHERFDGDGYPGRLRGEEITTPTRIFTLADAFSAMTTDRPYRKGLTLEMAIDQIECGAGTQFDPDLATSFVDILVADYQQMRRAA